MPVMLSTKHRGIFTTHSPPQTGKRAQCRVQQPWPPQDRRLAESWRWGAGGGLRDDFREAKRFELRIEARETAQARFLRAGQWVRTSFERSHLAFWKVPVGSIESGLKKCVVKIGVWKTGVGGSVP